MRSRGLSCPRTSLSSGRQSCNTAPDSAPTCFGSWISCISGSSGSALSASPTTPRSICRIATCIQISAPVTSANSSMKQLVHMPVSIEQHAERDRQHEAAKPADHADQAADRADVLRVIDGDVLVDRGLAQRHEEAEHENRDRERHNAHLQMERARPGDGADDVVGGRIRKNKRANDARPRKSNTSRGVRHTDRRDGRHRRETRWPETRTSRRSCRRP